MWADFLSSLRISEIGASGLVVIGVLLIFTGRLVTKTQADAWRDAYFKEKEAGDVMRSQISELTSAAQVTARVLDSLPLVSGGDPDVEETTQTRRRRRQG